MAITLNELLGNNIGIAEKKAPAFPSFENFKQQDHGSNVNLASQQKQDDVSYNFDFHEPTKITEEEIKAYEASTPYEAPKQTEFQPIEYDFLNRIERPTFNTHKASEAQQVLQEREIDFAEVDRKIKARENSGVENKSGLYEFTKNDNDRLSEEELMSKLEQKSATRVSTTNENRVAKANKVSFAQKEKVETEKKARLNTKGKVILGVYIAVILIVSILIGVHAGDINNGTAVAPTSNSVQDMYVETVDYLQSFDDQMNDMFGGSVNMYDLN